MATRASPLERILGWLIPPASREEVLGDLRERCGAHIAFEALRVIPFVIASRIRRTADPVVALMHALSLFTSFVLAAAWLDRALLSKPSGFARMETPVVIVVCVVLLADAYANPKKRPVLRPLLAPVFGFALACGMPTLPWPVMMWGGTVGTMLVMMLRFLIPPVADRPQTAKIPAHWQKLELDPWNLAAARLLLPFAAVVFLWIAVSGWLNGK